MLQAYATKPMNTHTTSDSSQARVHGPARFDLTAVITTSDDLQSSTDDSIVTPSPTQSAAQSQQNCHPRSSVLQTAAQACLSRTKLLSELYRLQTVSTDSSWAALSSPGHMVQTSHHWPFARKEPIPVPQSPSKLLNHDRLAILVVRIPSC